MNNHEIALGTGYTNISSYQIRGNNGPIEIPENGGMTGNLAIGLNLWFSKHWGFNFNATGKFGISSGASNQQQYSMGLVSYYQKNKVQKQRATPLWMTPSMNS